MRNWIIRNLCKLRIFVLYGWRYRLDQWRYRKAFAKVMCQYHIDQVSLKQLTEQIPPDTKHGPPCYYHLGYCAALRKIKKGLEDAKPKSTKSKGTGKTSAPYVQSVGRAKRPNTNRDKSDLGRVRKGGLGPKAKSLLREATKATSGEGPPQTRNPPNTPRSFA